MPPNYLTVPIVWVWGTFSGVTSHLLVFQTHSSILHWIQMSWGYFLTVTRHCTLGKKLNFLQVLHGSFQMSCLALKSLDQSWTAVTWDQLELWPLGVLMMVLLIPPAPRRPGIVNFYIVHSVKVNGEFRQHAFAVVWWYKIDCDQGHFGKPTQVWKQCAYEPCGPSLFMPVQRVAQKFACCSMKINGVDKLVISPIPRSFH